MEGSLYNTPPCWPIYICGLVFSHMLSTGGLSAMHSHNQAKAQLLYGTIDGSSGFYNQPVDSASRCACVRWQPQSHVATLALPLSGGRLLGSGAKDGRSLLCAAVPLCSLL